MSNVLTVLLPSDRVYLASYTHPPNASTPFPYPAPSKAPTKRSSKSQNGPTPVPQQTGPKVHPPAYFTVDDDLLYNRFHADFGPLHIGHLYRFAVTLHEVLGDPANEDRGVVFWSKPDSRSRANAACLLACYMVLIQSWPPHLALAPIAQADPPLMPFRDAGYSQADFVLNVQDVVYGIWKAKEEGLCGFKDFNLDESVCETRGLKNVANLLQIREIRASRPRGFQLGYTTIRSTCFPTTSTHSSDTSFVTLVCDTTERSFSSEEVKSSKPLQERPLSFL